MTAILTHQEAANYLRIGKACLKKHVDDGELLYVALGTGTKKIRRMYRKDDLDDFINGRLKRCQSIEKKADPTISTTSNSNVVDIMDRLEQPTLPKPKKLKRQRSKRRAKPGKSPRVTA